MDAQRAGSQALADDKSARRNAYIADGAFAAAGLAAAGAVYLFMKPSPAAPHAAVIPTAGGAAVVAGGSF